MSTISDFIRGDTRVFQLTIKDSDGDGLNITGSVITFTLKRKLSDTDSEAVFQKTAALTTPASGLATLTVEAEESDLFPIGKLFYDFELNQADGTVTTFLRGTVKVIEDVTRNG